ncbi:hypothetical protein Caci_6273 [Catenulispora acidiphila DSM 44928]|uniref:Uncharacterized protein n=1 Tax=Catenulispora acidiphila (strain DSM 44928 / JCM 14897 / NBRC 102108 / NRRL B-24433 / ID139908) TaxID=479433 RepID=C7QK53_CATAD|nr:hypothetical protein [Catenulispora acidiphila]ACU75127.1 hypothetical protein Caci_6273 [Catenulispora acidiphila DSM 44928]
MSVTRRQFITTGGAAAGIAVTALTATALGASSATARSRVLTTPTWMLAGAGFANLAAKSLGGDPAVCRRAFNTGRTWFITTYTGDTTIPSPVPAGYTGVAVLKFKCYQDGSTGLVDALAAGLPSWVTAVQYDAESWAQTPDLEQGAWLLNPHTQTSYAQLFCATAHSHGLKVVLTPGNDLCNNSPNPAYPQRKPQYPVTSKDAGQNYNAFIRHNMAAAAQYLQPGDIFEYQAQQLELDTEAYTTVTTKVAEQVEAANPATLFLAGLGRSKPPSDGANCADLAAAATGVADTAAGFWLNVGAYSSQVRPMICALRKLGY